MGHPGKGGGLWREQSATVTASSEVELSEIKEEAPSAGTRTQPRGRGGRPALGGESGETSTSSSSSGDSEDPEAEAPRLIIQITPPPINPGENT